MSMRRRDEELDEEIRAHLAMAARDRIERGEDPEAAALAVRREFGNRTLIKETTREMWGWSSLERLWQDVRYALRGMRRSPGFTAVAVLSLALGIGANTAIFSLVDALLLRWLPVRSPQELVLLATNPKKPYLSHSYPDYLYLREHSRSYSGLAGYSFSSSAGFSVDGRGHADLVGVTMVTGDFFDVLGVPPALGRVFNREDSRTEGAHPYAVLSHAFWQKAFAGDPNVIGRNVRINDAPFSIIGVARAGFTGAEVGIAPDLYIPALMIRAVNPSLTRWNTRGFRWLKVIGRLKPGVSLEQATLENQVLRRQIEAADPRRRPVPAWDKEHEIRERGLLLPGSGGSSYLRQRAAKPLFILMVIVGMVLLIACANVAGLLLARAAGRRREIAIRLAVGAGRGRLVMQLLVESVVLALLGGVAGLGLAWFGSGALVRLLPNAGPFRMTLDVSPDSRLLLYTVAISLLSGVIFGIAPALKATRPSSASWLKGEPPETTFVRLGFRLDWCRMLVAAQVALSIVLLIGAGLFLRSLQNLRDLDPGFQRDSLLLVRTDPFQRGYSPQRARAYYERLLEDARLLPGVRAASLASITPLGGTSWNSNVSAEGYKRQPEDRPFVEFNAVGPRYFETLGIPVLLGRDFRVGDSPAVTENTTTAVRPGREIDTPGPRVAIVNEAFARSYFAGQSAVGKRLSAGDRFDAAGSYEVVGVVRDVRYAGLRDAAVPMIYFPLWRHSPYPLALCLRGTGDPRLLIGAIRRQAAAIDAAIPLLQARSMEEFIDDSVLQERLVATLCALFGSLAVLLAAVGLYGVMSQAVSRRTREIGVRIAMGAPRSGVMRMVIRDALVLVAAGAAIGVPAALALSRYVASLLYGISPQDPAAVAVSIGLLAVVTVAAAWVPAHRATRIDPIRALRYE